MASDHGRFGHRSLGAAAVCLPRRLPPALLRPLLWAAMAAAVFATVMAWSAARAQSGDTGAQKAAASPPSDSMEPPTDLGNLQAWMDYKARAHVASLPHEARLFYRRGLLAHEERNHDEASRLVRGATELDPTFVAPHLTLASWSLLREPSQALIQYATVLQLAQQNFMLQLALAANALYLLLQALLLGVLGAAFLIVVLRSNELRHAWEEVLARHITIETARWWSWAFIALPFLAGFGPVLPTLFFLGLLWPVLRIRERVVFIALLTAAVGGPWTTAALDRMATPLHEDRAPLFGVPTIENIPWSQATEDRLQRLAESNPDNPHVAFGLAWTTRRGGHLPQAEAAYRRVLVLRPNDDRALNNLGNTLAMQGRPEEAMVLYEKAVELNPANAPAWFNASQLHTQRYEYKAATHALSRASALDFDLVKNYQAQGGNDGLLPLVEQWVAPRTFWLSMSRASNAGAHARALPPSWRGRIEAMGWAFTIMALLITAAGLALGIREHKTTPLRTCSNCGCVVCRRCAQRRRELALCRACATVESRAESPEFARVLLAQHRRRIEHRSHLVRTTFATLIPGFGLLSFRRVFTPVLLLTVTAALLSGALAMAPPFSFEPRLLLQDEHLPLPLVLSMWALVYMVSITGYFAHVARHNAQAAMIAAPVRSRSVQASRHNSSAAAA